MSWLKAFLKNYMYLYYLRHSVSGKLSTPVWWNYCWKADNLLFNLSNDKSSEQFLYYYKYHIFMAVKFTQNTMFWLLYSFIYFDKIRKWILCKKQYLVTTWFLNRKNRDWIKEQIKVFRLFLGLLGLVHTNNLKSAINLRVRNKIKLSR